ncbi:MAG: CIA30 family protein [Planctomycetes bacterium]|nr:CIA30 family protein [Planctomycetota bacterium]
MHWAPLAIAAALVIGIGIVAIAPGGRERPGPDGASASLATPAVLERDGRRQAASAGASLRDGDAISADAEVVIAYTDGTRLTLEPGARVELPARRADGRDVLLQQGVLRASVAPQATGSSFAIVTAQARVQVIGTRFSVTVGDGRTALAVQEGQVAFLDLASGGVSRIVSGGENAATSPPAPQVGTTLVIHDCERGDLSGGSHSAKSWARPVLEQPGKVGASAMRIATQADPEAFQPPWIGIDATAIRTDWRGFDGLRLWVKGGSTPYIFRVDLDQTQTGNTGDDLVRFSHEVTVTGAEWRQIHIPWSQFSRGPFQFANASGDPLLLTGMVSIALVFPQTGSIAIDQIELYGR